MVLLCTGDVIVFVQCHSPQSSRLTAEVCMRPIAVSQQDTEARTKSWWLALTK